jgi:tetratricopeptide (TPR) repeat protein
METAPPLLLNGQDDWGRMEKLFVRVLKLNVVILAISVSFSIFAEKMDEPTDSLVIDKLERALDLMDKNAPEKQGVLLRLGDLYSERARLKALDEGKKGCDNCDNAKEDRVKALSYYKQAFPKTRGEEQGKILVQMAQLNNLNGDGNKAQDLYKDVIKKGYKSFTSAVVGSANANTGDIYFRKGNFKNAKKYYEAALKEDTPSAGYIQYRLAWCELNLGNFEKATQSLVKILSTPHLADDPTFRDDVSHDLAAFLAHGTVGSKEIAMLKNLSPESSRRSNLFLLGTETDRLGNKEASLLVWSAYNAEGETKGVEKLEIQIRIAQSEYDLGRHQQALENYDKAIALSTQTKCEEKDQDKCVELKTRMRNFVTNWNKALKVKPTVELLRAYQIYLKGFPDDAEMTQWAALVAREVKQYRDAVTLFRKSALLAKNDKSPASKKILEGSLLGEMEMAEKSNDLNLREASYTFYLETNPDGEKAFESRFERANVWYKQGKYPQAYSEFHYIATAPGGSHRDIKIKAADLALDTLVLLKDDKSLEVRANEYAKIFPERRKEYAEIARKATLNQVASNLNSNKSTDVSAYKSSLAQLKTVNLAGASEQEKIKYWKNRITVALQTKDLNEVNEAANGLLGCKNLSQKDRELGYSQKEWVAELQLNFRDAYRWARQLSYPNLSQADRDLRLAFLAELSGSDSRRHYEDFLKHERNFHQRNLTRVTLVERSPHPWKELERHLSDLKRSPEMLAPLLLETYGRDRNVNAARRILARTTIAFTPQGRILAHQLDFNEFAYFHSRVASQHLKSSSDASLARSLKQRLDLLGEAGRRLQRFNRQHDSTMEVVALNLLAKENKRLADDLLRLPAPRKLSKMQKEQYHQLLRQKANGFYMQASNYERQWAAKWNERAIDEITRNFQNASWEVQNVLKTEIQILSQNAPEGAKNRLLAALKERRERPSNRELLTARQELQSDPFDTSKIQRLRELEKQAGQMTMVSYLDARLLQMKKGASL